MTLLTEYYFRISQPFLSSLYQFLGFLRVAVLASSFFQFFVSLFFQSMGSSSYHAGDGEALVDGETEEDGLFELDGLNELEGLVLGLNDAEGLKLGDLDGL